MLPGHDDAGFLPIGIHAADWAEFEMRFAFTPRRRALLGLVRPALKHFARAGATRAYVGGSFVTTKSRPGDVDVLIALEGLDPSRVHPALLDLSPDGRIIQKALFGAEFFPATLIEAKSGLLFIDFFQQTHGRPVGIVLLDLRTV
jgi:hypothetical protein